MNKKTWRSGSGNTVSLSRLFPSSKMISRNRQNRRKSTATSEGRRDIQVLDRKMEQSKKWKLTIQWQCCAGVGTLEKLSLLRSSKKAISWAFPGSEGCSLPWETQTQTLVLCRCYSNFYFIPCVSPQADYVCKMCWSL